MFAESKSLKLSLNKILFRLKVFCMPCFFYPFVSSFQYVQSADDPIQILETYFKNFESLTKSEDWHGILSQGSLALEAARRAQRPQDEARIYAQLTSTAFYLGDYDQALVYANHCHELSEKFEDPALFVRALYLESAVHRATAGKNGGQASYMRAVQIAEEALLVFQAKGIENNNLLGKIYFNLGAAHADNPKGDLVKAEMAYLRANQCYTAANANDDLIRTSIRLGKIYLLQKRHDLTEKVIHEVRPQIATERLKMHVDYLEAQFKIATNDIEEAIKIAKAGLARSQTLGAKEDGLRFVSLLHEISLKNTL
jgi:tetratricopeptide (TPR) repeat protein